MLNKFTLAIETAVGSGSLSLFENKRLLDQWSGESKISRSDRFLPILDEFLSRNKIKKKDLELIAVSRGPGSFTGARIGITTAVAIKNGLGVRCLGISVLRAMALYEVSEVQAMRNDVMTAILNDKTQVISEKIAVNSKIFQKTTKHSDMSQLIGECVKLQMLDDFVGEIKSAAVNTRILMEKRLYDLIDEKYGVENLKAASIRADFENLGDNLSFFIGKAAIEQYASDNLRIIYLNTNKNYPL